MDSKKGSMIAKNGFKNEKDVAFKFNNWLVDSDAQEWLRIMGYDFNDVEINAFVLTRGYKSDVVVSINSDNENIQVKLVSNIKGFNQIDKRWVNAYSLLWDMPDDVELLLKFFTGEKSPYKNNLRDKRRMFLNEFSADEQELIVEFFKSNKDMIVNDILRGHGQYAADWMLVSQKLENQRWILKPISEVISYYSQGNIEITKRGNLKIGKITMQRKGGDAGRPSANMLQFKINPVELFDLELSH